MKNTKCLFQAIPKDRLDIWNACKDAVQIAGAINPQECWSPGGPGDLSSRGGWFILTIPAAQPGWITFLHALRRPSASVRIK